MAHLGANLADQLDAAQATIESRDEELQAMNGELRSMEEELRAAQSETICWKEEATRQRNARLESPRGTLSASCQSYHSAQQSEIADQQQEIEALKAAAEEKHAAAGGSSSGAGAQPLSMDAFTEDWNESQFWVCPCTQILDA